MFTLKNPTYDALNRNTTATDALGNSLLFTYNAKGQITGIQDALGRSTSYAYSAVGLLTITTDAASHTTTSNYDLNGNKISISDPNGHNQLFGYDGAGRVISYTDGAGNIYTFTYDGVGNLLSETKPGGGTISKTYNAGNRVTHVANSTGDNYTYTFDANGNMLTETNATGTSAFAYDSVNHMKQYTDMFGNTVQYTYDLTGNKKNVIYPGNHTVSYSYNSDNSLDSVTDWLGHITRYNYDVDSRLINMVYPNSATCNYIYDAAGRLVSQTDSTASALISKSIFSLDANGTRTQEQRQGAMPAYLTAASFASSFGNDDRLISDSITAYSNDLRGNRASEVNTSGTSTYSFSVDNILNSFTSPILGTTSCLYDALGNRVEKIQGGVTRKFVLDLSGPLSQVLMEQDNAGIVKANYIYGIGLIARIDSAGGIQYYHHDAQHNVVALSNAGGIITDTYTYDPFGVMLKHTGTTKQPYTFLGQYGAQQETSSLYYVRARYYDAANGRFLSKDPYPPTPTNPQTLNRYVYGMNNPMSNMDPTGLYNWDALGIGLVQYIAGVGDLADVALDVTTAVASGGLLGTIAIASAGQSLNDAVKNFSAFGTNVYNSSNDNYEWKESDDFNSPLDYFYNDPLVKIAMLGSSIHDALNSNSILELTQISLGVISDVQGINNQQQNNCGN